MWQYTCKGLLMLTKLSVKRLKFDNIKHQHKTWPSLVYPIRESENVYESCWVCFLSQCLTSSSLWYLYV